MVQKRGPRQMDQIRCCTSLLGMQGATRIRGIADGSAKKEKVTQSKVPKCTFESEGRRGGVQFALGCSSFGVQWTLESEERGVIFLCVLCKKFGGQKGGCEV